MSKQNRFECYGVIPLVVFAVFFVVRSFIDQTALVGAMHSLSAIVAFSGAVIADGISQTFSND